MARYIDLDELLTNIDKRNGRLPLWLDEILMEDCKVADVVPVKHGHWIFKKRTKLVSTGIAKVAEDGAVVIMKKHITVKVPYCSICGERGDNEGDATPLCPNCGAIMDGDPDANGNDNKTPET